MGIVYTSGPNKALVVSGGCKDAKKRETIIGGWVWAWCCVTNVQKLSLRVMTLNPRCDKAETAQGVAVTITGVVQAKVSTQERLLAVACEQFLGKKINEISDILLQTFEGHLRAILGTLTVEEIYKDRDSFATLVRDVAAIDVGRMGIEVLSFTIKDIYDSVGYLDSLGKTQTANVKRDADIGLAEANRDAGIKEAECEKIAMETKYVADACVADYSRAHQLKKAEFDQEVNALKAEVELAYTLQSAKENQNIRKEELEVEVVERQKAIDVEEKEIIRKEKELTADVKLPAEAESYRVEVLSEGSRTCRIYEAQGDAEKIRLMGTAEASAIEAIGKAEAEKMRQKALAYKQYGDAALMSLILETMPKMAAEIASPLVKTEDIVIINDGGTGGSRVTNEVAKLAGELPPTVQALTGIDLKKVLEKVGSM